MSEKEILFNFQRFKKLCSFAKDLFIFSLQAFCKYYSMMKMLYFRNFHVFQKEIFLVILNSILEFVPQISLGQCEEGLNIFVGLTKP